MDKEMMVPLLAALFSGAVSWIARPFFGGYIPKKGENLATKQDIAEITRKIEAAKIEYVAQGEQIRAEIHALTHERQIKFSRLHDKRAEAIDGLYKRLVRTHGRFLPLAGGIVGAEDGNFGTRLEKAGSSARNLVLYFADHRLYFDQALIEQFEQLEQVLNGAWMTFALERKERDWAEMTREERARQIDEWNRARDGVRKEIPVLLERIENTMRDLLGDQPKTKG